MVLYAISFFVSALSLLYSFIMAQAITDRVGSTVVAYTLTIGFYLAAMGVGAQWMRTRIKANWKNFFNIEFKLCVSGALSVMVIYIAHMMWMYGWMRNEFLLSWFVFVLMAMISVVGVGFLTGLELPLLIKISKTYGYKSTTNRLLACDYFGALSAGLIFPLFFLPHLTLLTMAAWTALGNFCVAAFIFMVFLRHEASFTKHLTSLSLVLSLILAMIMFHEPLNQYFLKKYYYYDELGESLISWIKPKDDLPDVEHYQTVYQKIDIVDIYPNGNPYAKVIGAYSSKYHHLDEFPPTTAMFINGDFQFGTDFEELYHEYFAHVPVIWKRSIPQHILILGGGDGLLLKELLRYQEVKSITQVEIDPKMTDLVKQQRQIQMLVGEAFEDQRWHLIHQDALQFVKKDQAMYDAIYIDFPNPADYTLSKLFSREFYVFVRRRLNPSGFMVFDAPGIEHSIKHDPEIFQSLDVKLKWRIYHHTLKAAGFKTIIPYATILENSNPQARQLVKAKIGGANELIVTEGDIAGMKETHIRGRANVVERLLSDFTKGHYQGFILAQVGSASDTNDYWDPGVKMHVLNQDRYALSFDLPLSSAEKVDPRFVNSIMRPVLPDGDMWWTLRNPY